ncbi:anthranilate phosphoribosyltransferase [Rothia uropygioeca]|uniref:anthranilate phosphoribosyltransferase n=1 Tax=Kocuria sp. 257 TaxID=2021970 RepID=UPI0010122514|nr:anthranilate phosphoribosyltransferase [Kocuria sp. 257]
MSNTQDPTNQPTWKSLINAIERHEDLNYDEAAWAMREMMSGAADPVHVAAFLVGLHTKGETAEELHGLSEQMLDMAEPYSGPREAVDIVGTGGDQHNTVNISTMASLVMAGAGVKVVKHGNRASSSSTGSADALERLGLPLDAPADRVEASVGEVGISFLFANTYHPAMRYIGPIRRTLGVPTVFNYLGPLANPARVVSSVIGVSSARIAPLMADVFARRGNHALVFTGPLNLDELSLIGPTQMWEAHDGTLEESVIEVADINLPSNTLADITGKDPEFNADVIRRLVAGEGGPIRDTVVLNAAAGLVAASDDTSSPLIERINHAIGRAQESIDSGRAQKVLTKWIEFLMG